MYICFDYVLIVLKFRKNVLIVYKIDYMDNITISTHLNIHQKRKDGLCGIYLRITINRKSKYISLRKLCNPAHFNFENKRVKNCLEEPNAQKINRFLSDEESRIQDIVLDLQRTNKPVTFYNILRLFDGNVSELFIPWCKEEISKHKHLIKKRSVEMEEYRLNKIERFQKDVCIGDIDKSWLEKYQKYLQVELKNKINTIHGDFRTIRKYIRIALDDGLIKSYPFAHFKMETEEIEKEYLTLSELKILHKLYDSKKLTKMISKDKRGKTYVIGQKYQDVLQHFLIGCYTGLRHSDIMKLRFSNIQDNKIVIKMEKGKIGKQKTVRIPLTELSKSVLNLKKAKEPSDYIYSGYVRRRGETNRWLKDIMEQAKINKYMTFHCARHTFAINSIILGIPIEVVSDLLGHRDLRTTQIYAKIVDQKREDEMAKWGKAINNFKDEKVNAGYNK